MERSYQQLSDVKLLEDLGRQLCTFREQNNLTQQEAAEKADIGRKTLSRVEHGEGCSLRTFIHLLRVYDRLAALEEAINPPEVTSEQILEGAVIDGGTY